MSIFVNRVLNMKKIKVIGFDMDHTLVRYHSDKFEELTFNESIKKLIEHKNYPEQIKEFTFDFNKAIRGLVIDKENGNLLKVSLYNKIKTAYHGQRPLGHKEQKRLYYGASIDLSDSNYSSIDTTFSIAFAIMFSQLVDLKDSNPELNLPTYKELADDVLYAVDVVHRDGSLKETVKKNLDTYVIQDERVVKVLERFKKYGKKLWVITNSDYNYTKALLDHTIAPYLKDHDHWSDLFELTITLSAKPRFFTDKMPFLKVDPQTGFLHNYDAKVDQGIFQGGYATKIQEDHGLSGNEILYLGDHIYGDIVKLKKSCDWRTALIIEELTKEVNAYKSTKNISVEIDKLMQQKIATEKEIDDQYGNEYENGQKVDKQIINQKFTEIEKIDKLLAEHIKEYESNFNSTWGEVMRAGVEPSIFAELVERYACIYMSEIADFLDYSPRNYFRASKRKMAHEL